MIVTAKLLDIRRGSIKHKHRSTVGFWKSLKMAVPEKAALSSRNVHTWSLVYVLGPVCRDAFFFNSFWWHREKTVEFLSQKGLIVSLCSVTL